MPDAPPTREEHVALQLERDILSGRLTEGSPLRQDAVARAYGVSHIPVRAAFRKLEARGLVSIEPHRGARVVIVPIAEILEMLDLRVLLESEALKSAIPNLTSKHLDQAERIADRIERGVEGELWPALNWQFHECLYSAARRPVLLSLIGKMHTDLRSMRITSLITQNIRASNREHRRLLTLLRAQRSADALSLLKRHILIDPRKLRRQNRRQR